VKTWGYVRNASEIFNAKASVHFLSHRETHGHGDEECRVARFTVPDPWCLSVERFNFLARVYRVREKPCHERYVQDSWKLLINGIGSTWKAFHEARCVIRNSAHFLQPSVKEWTYPHMVSECSARQTGHPFKSYQGNPNVDEVQPPWRMVASLVQRMKVLKKECKELPFRAGSLMNVNHDGFRDPPFSVRDPS